MNRKQRRKLEREQRARHASIADRIKATLQKHYASGHTLEQTLHLTVEECKDPQEKEGVLKFLEFATAHAKDTGLSMDDAMMDLSLGVTALQHVARQGYEYSDAMVLIYEAEEPTAASYLAAVREHLAVANPTRYADMHPSLEGKFVAVLRRGDSVVGACSADTVVEFADRLRKLTSNIVGTGKQCAQSFCYARQPFMAELTTAMAAGDMDVILSRLPGQLAPLVPPRPPGPGH